MTSAYIGLGSNMEDAATRLREALEFLRRLPDARLGAVSPLYWTEPQGLSEQPWFANQVAEVRCGERWSPLALLRTLLEAERSMGRVRDANPALRFGPRRIDLDLLLFGGAHSDDPRCILPHPRMLERAFVLVPLRDIAPQVILSGGVTPDVALRALAYRVRDDKIFQ